MPTNNNGNGNGNGFWNTVGGWDWKAISDNALTWGYAFGFIKPPNATNMETQAYMMELQKQRQQMNMIMVGLGVLMLIIVIIVIRQGKKK